MPSHKQGLLGPHPALEEAAQVRHQLALFSEQDVLALLASQDVLALLPLLPLLPLEGLLPLQGEQQLLALLQGGEGQLTRA